MVVKNRFSKDPKVRLISIEEFLENSRYLMNAKKCLWKEKKRPELWGKYYKLTPQYLILINYSVKYINFGMDCVEQLDSIEVAIRDGETEYKLFDKHLDELQKDLKKHKYSKKLREAIVQVPKSLKLLPKYKEKTIASPKKFEEYLIDTGYKSSDFELGSKYLVFDVETNGTRKSNDDLLSLSIFDPSTGICYNRYFPLDLQPLILTSFIHGITDKTLADATHITQDELNQLINYFNINDRIMLSYSGGQGAFDSVFFDNYCKRHGLTGFEKATYENIKNKVPSAGFGTEGKMSKDNLCNLLKIEGVESTHSSINDCILEWKLYEKMSKEPLFFINQHLFKFHKEYIVPVSYLNKYPILAKYAEIYVPHIEGTIETVFSYSLPKKVLKEAKKFPTNITGISLENGINTRLNAVEQDNSKILIKNKSNLEYIGSLDSGIVEIPIEKQKNGTIKSLNEEFNEYVEEVNRIAILITNSLEPVFTYLKQNIFLNENIMSQELCISEDGKILALCDLSSDTKIVEIKTYGVIKSENKISSLLSRQLFYESKGRQPYVLSLEFEKHFKGFEPIIDAININIYKVKLTIF